MPIIKWSAIKQIEAFFLKKRCDEKALCVLRDEWRFVSYGTSGALCLTGRVTLCVLRDEWPYGALYVLRDEWRFMSYGTSGPTGRFDEQVYVSWI